MADLDLRKTKTLYAASRGAWRAWLKKHYRSEKDVWLIYYKKRSGKPRIPYNDAVEEALCFGWIDSTTRRVDGDRYAQRFSPRNPKSPYSQANLERLKALVKRGKVAKDVLAGLGNLRAEAFRVPQDILKAIKANPMAWKNFREFSKSYIRIRTAYIDGARDRPEEFKRRLANFIRRTEKKQRIGFGGIDKYY